MASDVTGIKTGERFYGYFPIASHLWMRPERVTERGFYDAAEHRQALTSAYNQYTRCSWDSYYSPETENLQILLKPLFLTSSMLADFLQDKQFFGATDEAQLTAIEGPKPVFFFAPIQIRKRNADWGPEGVSQHIGEGLQRFIQKVSATEKPLLEVIESQGYEAAQSVISRLFHGQVAPVEGHVIRL